MHFGITEVLILLIFILIVLGSGRIGKIAGELGRGLRKFKEGMKGWKDDETRNPPKPKE